MWKQQSRACRSSSTPACQQETRHIWQEDSQELTSEGKHTCNKHKVLLSDKPLFLLNLRLNGSERKLLLNCID